MVKRLIKVQTFRKNFSFCQHFKKEQISEEIFIKTEREAYTKQIIYFNLIYKSKDTGITQSLTFFF